MIWKVFKRRANGTRTQIETRPASIPPLDPETTVAMINTGLNASEAIGSLRRATRPTRAMNPSIVIRL